LYSRRKLFALVTALSLILIAFQVYNAKGSGGMVYIYYVETDRGTYELGQSVNVTAACYIQYDPTDPLQYSETIISLRNTQSCLSFVEWLNETNGFHVHHSSFTLNPDDWSPGQSGQVGIAECSLILQPDGTDEILRQNFAVTRSTQDCNLSKTLPTPLTANATAVTLFLRIFNRNNPIFEVGSNQIVYNVTNPSGLLIATNNETLSDPKGNFTISFDPNFNYGQYHIDLESLESTKYLGGRFNYTLWVGRSPIPSSLRLEWNYAGIVYNSSTSYALEPTEITTQLTNSADQTGIGDQQLYLTILDYSTLETVYTARMTTNSTGFASSIFTIPYQGDFLTQVSYEGLVNSWYPASRTAGSLIKAVGRELSIIELMRLPQVITLNHSYCVRYLVLDVLTQQPVPQIEVTVRENDSIVAEGITNDSGTLDLILYFSPKETDLIGSTNLLVVARSLSERSAFQSSVLHVPLVCKLPTSIRLQVSSGNVFEDGDRISFGAVLVSLDDSPIESQYLVFTVFIDGVENPYCSFTQATDAQGACSASLKLVQQGVFTIVATFPGNSTLGTSNSTLSFTVLPSFDQRLYFSGSTTILAAFLSIVSVVAMRRVKRKTRWEDVSIN
jgi:hypothetical protein